MLILFQTQSKNPYSQIHIKCGGAGGSRTHVRKTAIISSTSLFDFLIRLLSEKSTNSRSIFLTISEQILDLTIRDPDKSTRNSELDLVLSFGGTITRKLVPPIH